MLSPRPSATVNLIATAILAYRQTHLQARLTAIEQTRQRQEVEARQHADIRATVTGTPTALQLVLANDGPASASEVWASVLPVGSDDPPMFHGLNELEQAPAALRPGIGSVPGPDAGEDGRARTSRRVLERRRRSAPRIVHSAAAIGTGN